MLQFIKNHLGKPSVMWRKNRFNDSLEFLEYIDVELASHCNLNCKGCSHFSPIASKEYLDIGEFERDLEQLKSVLPDRIGGFCLLGGEPLLNEQINEYLVLCRKVYPNVNIKLVTNGLILNKKEDDFWEACKNNNIKIEVTKYPIKFDYNNLLKIANEHHVDFSFYGRTKYIQKTQYYLPFDVNGNQNPETSFSECFMARKCFTLCHGKLYTCSYAAYADRFNKFYNQNLTIENDDYVDIYNETDAKRILDKLSSPIPFCRYCDTKRRTYGNKWMTSKKDINEWT